MRIDKQDALALVKVLHPLVSYSGDDDQKTDFQETLDDLAERLDVYLVSGKDDEHDDCCEDEQEDDDDEEAEDDSDDEEEQDQEDDEEDDEDEDEDEESSEEDDEEDLDADYVVSGAELHDLTAAKAGQGTLEFEASEDDETVTLLIDGYSEYRINHLQRHTKALKVRSMGGTWTTYDIARFPKGWSTLLPLDGLVEVTDE